MLLALNAVLYVVALSLSLCVVTPVPEGATRRVRVARMSLACGGGADDRGRDHADVPRAVGRVGDRRLRRARRSSSCCLWVALSQSSSERDDGEDGSDGGGGQRRRPIPPAPPEPLGGPDGPELDWTDFDAVRAGWAREREPAGV